MVVFVTALSIGLHIQTWSNLQNDMKKDKVFLAIYNLTSPYPSYCDLALAYLRIIAFYIQEIRATKV